MHGGDIYRNHVELDFSVNINPYEIPERIKAELLRAVGDCRHYPDIENEELKQAIQSITGTRMENILCGNGASELFMAIVNGINNDREHFMKRLKIVIPVPSFYGYERAAQAVRANTVFYEMKEEDGFCIRKDIFDVLTDDTDMLFLANPNNPVGNLISPEFLEEIIEYCWEKAIIVVLDECFIEFTDQWKEKTFLHKTKELLNLIVVHSFTKIFAIPGVRMGYLVCENSQLLKEIEAQLPEWNLSVFAQRAGIAAAREMEFARMCSFFVRKEREYLVSELKKLGMKVYPSESGFLLIYTEHPLYDKLLRKGILIRDCKDFRGLSKGYYRIAVKFRKDNEKLLEKIGEIV